MGTEVYLSCPVVPSRLFAVMLTLVACLSSGMVVGPVLRPTASLLASHRHASPCAVDRVDRATAVRFGAAAVVAATSGVAPAFAAYPTLTIETTAGPMEFELWDDVAPAHVNSFRKLAQKGYFDGQAFHRIIPGFVIQGGDPNSKVGYGADGSLEGGDKGAQRKWGTGGPGYQIKAEFNERKHDFGVLSMARSLDPNLTLTPTPTLASTLTRALTPALAVTLALALARRAARTPTARARSSSSASDRSPTSTISTPSSAR
jgi:cyclophilin family peptidyl-prolyl cis-trans isomerase